MLVRRRGPHLCRAPYTCPQYLELKNQGSTQSRDLPQTDDLRQTQILDPDRTRLATIQTPDGSEEGKRAA